MSLSLPSLPDGWSWATVADVGATSEQAVLTGPFGTSLGPDDFVAETASAVPVLTIGCLREAGIDLRKATYVTPAKAMVLKRYRLRAGDVLFSRMATVGRAGLVRATQEAALFNYHIMRLRLRDDAIDPLFFIYYVRSSEVVRAYVRSVNHGMTRDGINTEQLVSMPLPIAPRNQQRRIVEAIEDLLSRLDAAVANLEAAHRKLNAYRASVLKAAVEGRLVPTEADLARKEGRSYEPADELLVRILKERRRRWEEAELAKMRAAGKAPTNDRWKEKYRDPDPPDTRSLPKLPQGWAWASWNQVGFSQNGRAFPSSQYGHTGIRLLRPGNLHQNGKVEWNDKNTRHMPERWAVDHPQFLIGENELVINLTAQSLADEFLGRVCVTGLGEKCLLNQRIARLTPVLLSTRYLLYVFKSPLFRHFVASLNTGSLIQHMFTSQLSDFVLPVPPLQEQERIAFEVERLASIADACERTAVIATRRSRPIRQAILGWAFQGKLVDDDPNDEPADVLLARIRGERAAVAPPAGPKRARTMKAAS